MTRDHPRSRGVYYALAGGCEHGQGSSPLARGLLLGYVWEDGDAGIIPARAGFTAVGRRVRLRWRDHPRSRGVYSSQRW